MAIRGVEDTQFLVTLPSNACNDKFPNNRAGKYKTQLAVPIDLAGGSDWEVALVDVQYPQSWLNIAIKTRVVLALSPGRDSGVVVSKSATIAYKWPEDVQPPKPTKDEQYRINVNSFTTKLIAVEFEMQPGNYESVSQFGKAVAHALQNALDRFFGPRHKLEVAYKMDPTNRTGALVFTNCEKAIIFADNEYLMNVLGYKRSEERGTGSTTDPFIYVYYLLGYTDAEGRCHPSKASPLRPFSIYIYTDIIKPQLVGDIRAPLLGVVPVVNPPAVTSGNTVGPNPEEKLHYWCFNPVYYMPLRLTRFSTIDILLCTDEGKEVVFGSADDKVVCRLHFQRRGGSIGPI